MCKIQSDGILLSSSMWALVDILSLFATPTDLTSCCILFTVCDKQIIPIYDRYKCDGNTRYPSGKTVQRRTIWLKVKITQSKGNTERNMNNLPL